jgi:hypothetical protein
MPEIPNDGAVGRLEQGIVGAGDATIFDSMQNSGDLYSMPGGTGERSRLVYPEDMHNNPTKGNIIHFDIFYKKPATMEDVVRKVKEGATNLVNKRRKAQGDEGESNFVELSTEDQEAGDLIRVAPDGGAVKEAEIGPPVSAESEQETTRLGKATEKSKDKIALFMPTGIQNTDSMTYSEQDFSVVKNILDMEVGALLPGAMSSVAAGADSIGNMIGLELNSEAALNAVTGVIKNPRKEQLFNDVAFRDFEFAFNFFPKSKQESELVRDIIKMFRFHAHPIVSSNQVFYNMPSEFQITYQDLSYPSNNPFQQVASLFGANSNAGTVVNENMWLNKIGRCVLKNVVVDYTPLGRLTAFSNGAPAAVTLSLTFSELEAIDRLKVYQGY